MMKLLIVVVLALLIVGYARMMEEYQNFSYYSGYGNPVYGGVPSQGAPYYGHGHGLQHGSYDLPENHQY